ncbi:MAG: dihydroneopterin aldolase [Candidatus Halalkalibacterium sp. M3_1C_030]
MDKLTLKGLRFRAKHGYYEEERREGNDFEVDLIFHADLSEAGRSDNLEKTIDYQKAENIVKGIMLGSSVKLIETLTVRIGDALFEAFEQVNKLEVNVRKLNPPLSTDTQYSEVHMTWRR